MASGVAKFRFVRCPKCFKVLTEIADVPVYSCGGCGTVLQAKNRNTNVEKVTSGSVENDSQNLSNNVSLDNGSASSREKMIPCSSDVHSLRVDTKGDQNASPIHYLSPLDSARNCHEKGESSETRETGTDSNYDSPKSANQLVFSGSHTNLSALSQLDEIIPAKTEFSLNGEVDRSLKHSQEDCNSLTSSNNMEENAESIGHSGASEEDIVDRKVSNRSCDSSRSPTTRNSHVCDGSISSYDNGCKNCNPDRDLLLSETTSRHQMVSGSVDIDENEGDVSGNVKISADEEEEEQLDAKSFLSKPSNEMYASAIMGSFETNRDELSSRYGIHARERGTSQDSEEFYSVQNWKESESDVLSRSLSKDSAFQGDSPNCQNGSASTKPRYLEHDPIELLRKVDELRDQLSELYDQRGKENKRSHIGGTHQEDLRPPQCLYSNFLHRPPGAHEERTNVPQLYKFSQMPFSGHPYCPCLHCHAKDWQFTVQLPPTICCNNGLCRACPYNMCCHPSNSANPWMHMDSNPHLCSHKVQPHEHGPEKLQPKEKKQPTKRHCRPISGGAPFVICYKCLELLQLPADFLTSRRRWQKLQCGACSEVLVFSYHDRAHIIPQTPTEVEYPPSQVDNSSEALTGHEASVSHSNDLPQGDHFSYEEHGISFGISYSTESEPEPVLNVSRNSSVEGRNGKQVTGSPLHRLMGYSSASELVYQHGDFGEGYESTESIVPHSHRLSSESHVSNGLKGTRMNTPLYKHSAAGASPSNMEIHEEDESPRRTRARRGVLPIRRLVKKGIRELNHGLESIKLKVHVN